MVTKTVPDQDRIVLVPQLTKDRVQILMRMTLCAEGHVLESFAVIRIDQLNWFVRAIHDEVNNSLELLQV